MIPKRKFEFPKTEHRVDLYLDGKKVVDNLRGELGNYYFRIPESVEVELTVAEHDKSIPIEALVTKDGLEPVRREPRMVKTPPKNSEGPGLKMYKDKPKEESKE